MAVYKDEKTSTWRAIYRYVDWTGEKKQTQKRGFKTKREAQAWEREQLNNAASDLDMSFANFVEHYTEDVKTRIKENTWATKDHCICVLTVHHTRKQPAGDSFEMISGTTGLLGCADGSLLMQKKKRTDLDATIDVVGRDQQDQILYLRKDPETQIWQLEKMENELHKEPPDRVLEAVSTLVSPNQREWTGSPSELADAANVGMAANILTKYLNVKSGRLLDEYHVSYENKAKHTGRQVKLAYMVIDAACYEVIS